VGRDIRGWGPTVTAKRPIVIAGLPRSGTTWTMQVLNQSPGIRRVPEPDNEDNKPSAIHAKHRLGRYPVLRPGEEAAAYRQFWEWVFSGAYDRPRFRRARRLLGPGGRERIFEGKPDLVTWVAGTMARNPRPGRVPAGEPKDQRVVAKSIHLQLALEWLTSEFDVDVLVLLRHPANILASWMEVKLKDSRNSTLETRPEIRARYVEPWGVPLPGPDPIEQMSWRIGLLTAVLEDAISRNPGWHVRTHEALCNDPAGEFRAVYSELGLEWTEQTDNYLRDHNMPGTGFIVNRVAAEVSDSWQTRLDDDQLATLRRVLGWFPISRWTAADFERTIEER
jgi:hypothetical protein